MSKSPVRNGAFVLYGAFILCGVFGLREHKEAACTFYQAQLAPAAWRHARTCKSLAARLSSAAPERQRGCSEHSPPPSSLKRLAAAALTLIACAIAPTPAQAQIAAGPGAWSANQSWAADTVNGGNLTGYFYWPKNPPTLNGKRALVLVLHGCTQIAGGDVIDSTGDGGFNWKTVAEQYGAVILAPNATGNVYSNHCWDYASTSHNRSSGHDGVLLDLIKRFSTNSQYAIDPNQVYVAGLSSGGGETMALGCLAPDVFSGVGINAGPPPGTTTAQISYVPSGYNATTAGNNCKALAGSSASSFATQVAGVVWGTADYTVSQQYGPMDAQAMRLAYGGNFTQGSATAVATGGTSIPYLDANGKLRTTEITVNGMGHAWPAGSGGQNTNFVDAAHVNYPVFLMDFWFKNNLRVTRANAPTVSSCSASVSGTSVTVSASGTDSAGTISSWRVVLTGPSAVDDAAAGSGASFSKQYADLANGYYSGSVTATERGTGLTSNTCSIAQFLVGSAPALQPPSNLSVTATTSNSVSLSWSAASGAGGYNVYRNYAHVQAGRAHDSGGYALANGSNQNMGLDNTFYTSTLAQTASGYYVIGTCP